MGDWLYRFFNTPMIDLPWWQTILAVLFIVVLFAGTVVIFLWAGRRRDRRKQPKRWTGTWT